MSNKTKEKQKLFMGICLSISKELKQTSALGFHGVISYVEFLERFILDVERMKKHFKKVGL